MAKEEKKDETKRSYYLNIRYRVTAQSEDDFDGNETEDMNFTNTEQIEIGLAKLVGKYIRTYDFADEFLAALSKELGIDEK